MNERVPMFNPEYAGLPDPELMEVEHDLMEAGADSLVEEKKTVVEDEELVGMTQSAPEGENAE